MDIHVLHAVHIMHTQEVITALRTDDEMQQLEALSHLCEVLSMSTDDTLAAFPVEQTVPLLVCDDPQLFAYRRNALHTEENLTSTPRLFRSTSSTWRLPQSSWY